MKQAKITCVSLRMNIEDLGLVMVRGQIEYVDEDQAKGSENLECLRKAGGVLVQYVRRVFRAPQVTPEIETPTDKPVRALPPSPAEPPAPPVVLEVDYEKLADMVADRLKPSLEGQDKLAGEVRAILEASKRPGFGKVSPDRPKPVQEREERIFIPDVEVSDEFTGTISVEEAVDEGGTVDEAAAALRKARAASKEEKP